MSNVHIIAIRGEVSRLRTEIKQLLAAYMYLLKTNATLEERKKIRLQIKMLLSRAGELQGELSDVMW